MNIQNILLPPPKALALNHTTHLSPKSSKLLTILDLQ